VILLSLPEQRLLDIYQAVYFCVSIHSKEASKKQQKQPRVTGFSTFLSSKISHLPPPGLTLIK
jgi:hypothetical protein